MYADQQANGGQWNLLGTFRFDPAAGHKIEISDVANGAVIADAIKLVPTTQPATATWTPTISTSDSYEIYTRWTSHHNRATDATYTVHHQGGSSTVVVNQQEDGGEWRLLGTYNFDPSANHRVELDDEANGTVVADAVYLVSASTVQNSVTWEPTLASSALVDVYAIWIDGADRSDAVTYTVHHAGGSTTINRNQRTNGTVWNWLGQFTMNPSSNHRVEVTDSTDGIVVADAVRFVSVTTSGAGLMYVHNDHLGTPQKMTDGSQALVWDAVYEPFGEVHSLTGQASNNQRFPGQYFDSESGFSYNYFRDYDASTGRYVQSDPIGLSGGLNTYGYAFQNPIKYFDPRGTNVTIVCRPIAGSHIKHCAVFVWHWKTICGKRVKVTDKQYSISGGDKQPGDHTKDYTEKTDRNAFDNPGGSNEHYDIPPPDGYSQQDFDFSVIQKGETYSADYWLYPGPNSNTAADNIVEGAGGTVPDIPGAYGQNYGE